MKPRPIVLAAFALACCAFELRTADAGTTLLASVNSRGRPGNGNSGLFSISADGRFVAFLSSATNLVPGDTNGQRDIFVRDLSTGRTRRVNVSSAGEQADDDSYRPVISSDGRFVAFESYASNLVPDDQPFTSKVFVHELATGITERISVNTAGEPADRSSYHAAISSDGRYVAFESRAFNLGPGESGAADSDIFIRDRQSGTTSLVSANLDGQPGRYDSYNPSLSADGRQVAFSSWADDLVPDDDNQVIDCFVQDRSTGVTQMVSVDSAGNSANGFGWSDQPVISADGTVVAFESAANNLAPGDKGPWYDVFLRDLVSGTTTWVSVGRNGRGGNESSNNAALSADGRYIAFQSAANNLTPGDGNGVHDVFLHNRLTGKTHRVSISTEGDQADGESEGAAISADGRFVVFHSLATNLVPRDKNGALDVFVRDRGAKAGASD